ncbi:hypothetical protein [Clostridium sp. BJN0001]|uniref:hypothetical protein n=1 Tax=Clostridium sp. BJN0001 TaxID=2930219 RepID=UPI001FCF7E89|nr:hypothetical protein [Clostridium sp. BJN0001]
MLENISIQCLFIICVIFIMYRKNKKIEDMQIKKMGESTFSAIYVTIEDFFLSVFAGTVLTVLFNAFQIKFSNVKEVFIIFIISIILYKINHHLICFSYSASIFGLFNVLFIDAHFNLINLILFVALLHIVEGFLIIIDGHKCAVPFIKNESGITYGGFTLRKYYGVPFIVMVNNILSGFFVIYALLGYSSSTHTMSKRGKSLYSGILIVLYGSILYGMSLILNTEKTSLFLIILMPFLHETMLILNRKIEKRDTFKFVSSDRELTILEVCRGSEADTYGIKSGFKIISVSGQKIKSEEEIYSLLEKEELAVIKIIDLKNVIKDINYKHTKGRRTGMMIVPYRDDRFSTILGKITES